MSMRKTLIALIGVVVMCGACNTSGPAQPTPADPPSAAPTSTSAGTEACTALGGTVDAGRTCEIHIATATYEINFTFAVDYPDQQAITEYVTQRRDGFIDFATERPPRDLPYELDARSTSYHSGTPTSGTASLVFRVYNDSGGAHPNTGYQAFAYDIGEGVPITLETLFKPGTQPVDILEPLVGRELQKRFDNYAGDRSPMPQNTLGAKMYQNFAITDDAVIFFFGQGQWLSQVDGPQEVSIPRAELASVLALPSLKLTRPSN